MSKQFSVGQRWLSENEPELGLGIIERVDHRLVAVFYPASEDQRTYASDSAPLIRVEHEVGNQIENLDGQILSIKEVISHQGALVYMVQDPQDPTSLLPLPETQISHHIKLDQAKDRLFSGQLDSMKWFQLRFAAMQAKQNQQSSPIIGLQGPRVDLIGHQLYIAHEIGSRFAPRVLLSDEVGLGKTIEAGMIIHQQLVSHRAQRVLIVVPPSLVHQWFVEMYRRFNLHFSIFDQSRIDSINQIDFDELEEAGMTNLEDFKNIEMENPFLSEQLILCSTEFMAACPIEQLVEAEWDLLIVDEAHHLEWTQEKASNEYTRIEKIAQRTAGLLLLSATPEQLGQEGHFARLRLLDPNRFYDYQKFLDEQKDYHEIASLVTEIESSNKWSSDIKKRLKKYVTDIEINEQNHKEICAELIDRNGTGRIIYRNTRKNIKGFPARHLNAYELENCQEYRLLQKAAPQCITTAIYPESQFEDDTWCQFDPRVSWLKDFLKQNRQEKIVIICANKETAINLDLYCRFKHGINCCTFHEDLDLVSRDRAAAYFADQEDGAQAIFCSEIGSEGRNFQFSHHLVLMDLPLNPDLLEQRIGRLDRIGQSNDIEIHLPYLKDTGQDVLYQWYHRSMDAFEKTNQLGGMLFQQMRDILEQSLLQPNNKTQLESLIEKSKSSADKMLKNLDQGKNRLLEIASYDDEIAQNLIQKVQSMDKKSPKEFIEKCWNRFSIDYEDHSQDSYVVRPGPHMFISTFPALPNDGMTITYDRKKALARDDIHFLSWEHPMISGAIDLVLSENKGNASVCLLKNKAVKAGTILIETLYKLESIAPKYVQAQRYLPFQCFRFLVDINGADIAPKVSHKNISAQCSKLDKRNARLVVKTEDQAIKKILKMSSKLAQEKAAGLLDKAIDKMHQAQKSELNRLTALKLRNPNIREEEIQFIDKQTQLLDKYLKETQLQLDAIRIIVAV